MVLHSQTPEPVGPIRSGRTQDIMLLESLNHPLFLWSGGNANVTAAINGSELVNLSPSTANGPAGFYREGSRQAPHNLYASSAKAWEAAPEGLSPPPPQFTYAAAGTVPAGLPVAAADLSMEGGLDVRWEYDAASGASALAAGEPPQRRRRQPTEHRGAAARRPRPASERTQPPPHRGARHDEPWQRTEAP